MQLSQDLLLYIGQNYLKDTLCIKKLFYHNKDDKLQLILFGEVLHYHKLFSKTTIPLKFLTKCSHTWFANNFTKYVPRSFMPYEREAYIEYLDDMWIEFLKLKCKCNIFVTFESMDDDEGDLEISIEYIDTGSGEIMGTIPDLGIQEFQPKIYKKLNKLIYKKIINFKKNN